MGENQHSAYNEGYSAGVARSRKLREALENILGSLALREVEAAVDVEYELRRRLVVAVVGGRE